MTSTASTRLKLTHRDTVCLLALLASGACFGVTFVLGKRASQHDAGDLQAAQLTLFRFLFSALFIPLVYGRAFRFAKGHHNLGLIARGIFGVLSAYLGFKAVMHPKHDVEVAVASLLNSTYVVFAPLFAWALLSDRAAPSRRSWLAIVLTMAGIVLLQWDRVFVKGLDSVPWAELWALGSGVLAGASVVLIQQLRSGNTPEDPQTIVFYYALIAVFVSGALCFTTERWHAPTFRGWAIVVMLGVANFGAQWLMAFGLRLKDTVLGTVMFNLQTVVVAVLGWLLFQQTYSAITITAATIILSAGVWLSIPRADVQAVGALKPQ